MSGSADCCGLDTCGIDALKHQPRITPLPKLDQISVISVNPHILRATHYQCVALTHPSLAISRVHWQPPTRSACPHSLTLVLTLSDKLTGTQSISHL